MVPSDVFVRRDLELNACSFRMQRLRVNSREVKAETRLVPLVLRSDLMETFS